MTESVWSIADAKSKLSEVLNRAEREIQIITRRDRRYVVMDAEQFMKLTGQSRGLVDHLIDHGPRIDDLNLMPRSETEMRDLDL